MPIPMLRNILISALTLWLAGCATTPTPPETTGKIERLTPEELARMLPRPDPRLPLEQLVRMSKQGKTAADVIASIRQTGSRYALSASQAIELHRQGVDKEVLDYIQSAREQELRDRMADEINQREQRHAEQLRREQELRRNSYYYDPWWPRYPGFGWNYGYPMWPYGAYRR